MRAAILALAILSAAVAARADDLPVPRGSRASGGALVSSDGFRATVDYIAKALDTRGIAVHRVGPYRARGVDVVRFLVDDTRAPWTAIHVWRVQGKTWISFVKRSP